MLGQSSRSKLESMRRKVHAQLLKNTPYEGAVNKPSFKFTRVHVVDVAKPTPDEVMDAHLRVDGYRLMVMAESEEARAANVFRLLLAMKATLVHAVLMSLDEYDLSTEAQLVVRELHDEFIADHVDWDQALPAMLERSGLEPGEFRRMLDVLANSNKASILTKVRVSEALWERILSAEEAVR